jgi:glycosyltransferase involved in cell wall biosynthesis
MRSVLFYRDFRRFTGGHLKVWDYFNHVLSSGDHQPYIRFSPETIWDRTNPWLAYRRAAAEAPTQPDVRFVAGTDWATLPPAEREAPRQPVVNLIQHVRHATPGDKRYEYLRHPAVRICVSEEVAEAVRTAAANGPVFTIPNGIDVSALPAPSPVKEKDLFIAAMKQRKLGGDLLRRLKGSARRIDFLDRPVPRAEFLQRIGRARVTLFLPDPEEGFYLPAIEGMALGSTVVCPDCVGNRSFCTSGENCFRPEHDPAAIEAAVRAALALSPPEETRLRDAARRTVEAHSLEGERTAFLALLRRLPELWKEVR